jgi:hypothetical protein
MNDNFGSGTEIDPCDRGQLRQHLEWFAGADSVTVEADGRLTAEFGGSTFVSVDTDGHVWTGMPLHTFEGECDWLAFDHDAGEMHVGAGDETVTYSFRRP